jgi:hypothetical protein
METARYNDGDGVGCKLDEEERIRMVAPEGATEFPGTLSMTRSLLK